MRKNHIYHEDCRLTLASMPDNAVDMVLTSPPYNLLLRTMNGAYVKRSEQHSWMRKYQDNDFSDALPVQEYYALHSAILTELLRVAPLVCYNFQVVTGSKEAMFQIIGEFRRYIKDIIVWDKGHGEPSINEGILNANAEFILVLEQNAQLGRKINQAQFPRGTMSNVVRVKREKSASAKHGATMPLALAKMLITAFCPAHGIVYDPFGGTGTTCVAAQMLGRTWAMSEINRTYVEIAERRLQSIPINLFELHRESQAA